MPLYNGEYYDSIRMGILREEWNGFKKDNPLFDSHKRTSLRLYLR